MSLTKSVSKGFHKAAKFISETFYVDESGADVVIKAMKETEAVAETCDKLNITSNGKSAVMNAVNLYNSADGNADAKRSVKVVATNVVATAHGIKVDSVPDVCKILDDSTK